MPVKVHHGDVQSSLPGETLATDVVGGSVKSAMGVLCIASVSDVADSFYEGWKIPTGTTYYQAPKAVGVVFADGADVFFDIANDTCLTAGGDGKIGKAYVEASGFGGGAAADDYVLFCHRDW